MVRSNHTKFNNKEQNDRQNQGISKPENGSVSDQNNVEGQIEKIDLGNKLKFVDLGLDISTSIVGVCILNHETGALVQLNHISLSNCKNFWDKAEFVKTSLTNIISCYDVKRIFVEESAKGFAVGFSSANTLFTLAKFNGIVSYIAKSLSHGEVIDVNVNRARKILGIKINREDKSKTTKEKVREQLLLLYPWIPVKKHIAKTGKHKGQEVADKAMEDELDSFVIAKAGQKLNS